MSERRVLSLGEIAERGELDPEIVNKIAHWMSVTKEVLRRSAFCSHPTDKATKIAVELSSLPGWECSSCGAFLGFGHNWPPRRRLEPPPRKMAL